MRKFVILLIASCFGAAFSDLYAEDWPMWRYDAGRTGATTSELSDQLQPLWIRELETPRAAWPATQEKLQFDASYEPVVMGKTIFVPSMVRDRVTAYDTETGAEKWRFYTNGPVRFAPVAWRDRVFFVSDDGFLYCLDAASGRLAWKMRGGPRDKKILGNGRLVAAWPARGAPVVYDDKIYFAAGIWPFMGTFIHAVDAQTGKVVWTNSGSGAVYLAQQHNAPAFAGVAPQGYIAATADRLLISGGRTVPGVYDRATGKFLYFEVASRQFGKDAGGYGVHARDKWFFVGDAMYRVLDGSGCSKTGATVFADGVMYGLSAKRENVLATPYESPQDAAAKPGAKPKPVKLQEKKLFANVLGLDGLHLAAGRRLFGAKRDGTVAALDADGDGRPLWQAKVDGTPWGMLAADRKLFVVTREGGLHCFGAATGAPKKHGLEKPRAAARAVSGEVSAILKTVTAREGCCLVLGERDAEFFAALAGNSEFHVIALFADPEKADSVRRKLDDLGLLGERVEVHAEDLLKLELPAYLADLIVDPDGAYLADPRFAENLLRAIRPYGGALYAGRGKTNVADLTTLLSAPVFGGIESSVDDRRILLTRKGALPGAGDWTHQYGDAAQSVMSRDSLVRAPLGVLWFGGPSHEGILPRHGHGPSPQVVGGRLFIEGVDFIRAVDVYTGRLLWQTRIPEIGKPYNNIAHQPGANAIGSNFASAPDGVYATDRKSCFRLDPVSGAIVSEFKLPAAKKSDEAPEWGYIGVSGELLLAGAMPLMFEFNAYFLSGEFDRFEDKRFGEIVALLKKFDPALPKPPDKKKELAAFVAKHLNTLLDDEKLEARVAELVGKKPAGKPKAGAATGAAVRAPHVNLAEVNRKILGANFRELPRRERGGTGNWNWDKTSSKRLVALDRHSGKAKWEFEARRAFRHNAVAVGGGKVFVIDRYPDYLIALLQRRGETPEAGGRIVALDLKNGAVVWEKEQDGFGTWLGYSAEHDLLVQGSRSSRDMLPEDASRINVLRGRDGAAVWDKKIDHAGPLILHGERIISNAASNSGSALSLLTGAPVEREHPITGQSIPWRFIRQYGCGTAVASVNVLTFRSGAAGFYDLLSNGGTGNFGGFKSGCTSNLIVANGVLNAPDYTRTCTCSYQNQASLAFVHDPDVEVWTFGEYGNAVLPVRRVGLNFGAPGDRMADNGTLWLDYPSVGGKSPDLEVNTEPAGVETFRIHSTLVEGDGLKWVAASGLKGIQSISARIADKNKSPRRFKIRLYFMEPDDLGPGERVFDVTLGDKTVLSGIDVAGLSGGRNRILWRDVEGDVSGDYVKLDFKARKNVPLISGIELIAK